MQQKTAKLLPLFLKLFGCIGRGCLSTKRAQIRVKTIKPTILIDAASPETHHVTEYGFM
jgi:hypothetical protein